MKIILSRKGFDNENGKIPSPIMPCGRLLSLPIPVNETQREGGEQGIPYGDLRFDGLPISVIISQLSNGQFAVDQPAHLDPDLDRERYTRERGWRPVFGQVNGPQTHLQNNEITVGDIFLFFGRFKHTRLHNDRLVYEKPSRDLHVIFGWLQIGKKHLAGDEPTDEWLEYHPHIVNANVPTYRNNMLYVASDQLTLEDSNLNVRGGGVFPCFKPSLQLTDPGQALMSHWRLPKWFYPSPPKPPLTHHKDTNTRRRWSENGNYAFLESAYPGQEFVLDTKYYPGAIDWLEGLFETVE